MIWFVYILIDAVVNWYLIEKKKTVPNYLQLTIIRSMAMGLFGAFYCKEEIDLLYLVLATSGTFWMFFDIFLNFLRRKPFLYLGKNSMIDRFGKKYFNVYWSLKIVYFLISIWAFYKLYA